MTVDHIIQATEDCQAGLVHFNNGNTHSFLFRNTWYPIRAIINYASNLARENEEYRTNGALTKLVEILPYVKIEVIPVINNKYYVI